MRSGRRRQRHREVAGEYRRLGLLDHAYDHLAKAIRLDSRDAEAYEALARIWRDWGFSHLGLGDAHRAVYYAPNRASAHNTLGTLLQALGHPDEARKAYRRALALEPAAAYALNNLCYLSFTERKPVQAIDECRAALKIEPSFAAAHNNLALAYAAAGRQDLTHGEFAAAGGGAVASYNLGVVYMAQARYSHAAEAFERAHAERPSFTAAKEQAHAARVRALTAGN